jgi:hypothetical protein
MLAESNGGKPLVAGMLRSEVSPAGALDGAGWR